MALQLAVEPRDTQGKHSNRRLRRSGQIPAILYGHGLECVPLSVAADVLTAAIRHGSRLVELTGAANESAFIRELQWDTWGTHIVHVDFTRISEHEIVEVRVPVELRGEAPGVREGGRGRAIDSRGRDRLPRFRHPRQAGRQHQPSHAGAVGGPGQLGVARRGQDPGRRHGGGGGPVHRSGRDAGRGRGRGGPRRAGGHRRQAEEEEEAKED